MNFSPPYILLSLLVLAAVMVILILTRKKMGRPLSRLAKVAFLLVLAGVVFGELSRWAGYGLLAAGVILAVIDIIKKANPPGNLG